MVDKEAALTALAEEIVSAHGGPDAVRAKIDGADPDGSSEAPPAPDFDAVAQEIAGLCEEFDGAVLPEQLTDIVEALRSLWNARGAADLAKIEAAHDVEGVHPSMKILDAAIRSLDR